MQAGGRRHPEGAWPARPGGSASRARLVPRHARGEVRTTGPEHWAEADLILSGYLCEYGCLYGGASTSADTARAQVHAGLALTAAVVAGADMKLADRAGWQAVITAGEP